MKRWILVPCLLLTLGCEPAPNTSESLNPDDDTEYVLHIVIDLSGSFQKLMAEDGYAYNFTMRAVDRYFQDRIGSNHDQLIISQISGSDLPMMWQGTPQGLRQEFPDQKAFRDFLIAHADPNGSRVNDGICDSLFYLSRVQNVDNRKAKTVTLILSDMIDNAPDSDQSEARMIQALVSYHHQGGRFGLYFIDQLRWADLTRKFDAAGMRMVTLSCDINGQPPLPSFE